LFSVSPGVMADDQRSSSLTSGVARVQA
jgi:hypothetical protein